MGIKPQNMIEPVKPRNPQSNIPNPKHKTKNLKLEARSLFLGEFKESRPTVIRVKPRTGFSLKVFGGASCLQQYPNYSHTWESCGSYIGVPEL